MTTHIDTNCSATSPMSQEELLSLLNTLLESERAGIQVLRDYTSSMPPWIAEELVEPKTDEAPYCRLLYDFIQGLGKGLAAELVGS